MSKKPITGTREWAKHKVNCVTGCSHNCRYCYARADALRFKRLATPEGWATMKVRLHDVDKPRGKRKGRTMFPTTHDITPETVAACVAVLRKLAMAGNDILIVSKPHLSCIRAVCVRLAVWREQITFRFSIGAMDDAILSYWEPGAPAFDERLQALKLAHETGYATSISCEPLLDAANAAELVDALSPWVTDTVWVGMMNQIRRRVVPGTDEEAIVRIEQGQTPEAVQRVYGALKDYSKVRWKDSYRKSLGLALATEAEGHKQKPEVKHD